MTYQKRSKDELAARVAQDIHEGDIVNLGIGMPTLVANHIRPGLEVLLHSENGILGMGPAPAAGEEDYDLINAGKQPVTLRKGGSFFHHADSFAMVRDGHLDVAIPGVYEVAETGDLANWSRGHKGVPAVGGAMDPLHGAKMVVVITDHVTEVGKPKLLMRYALPLTGVACVTRVYSSLAVIDIVGGHFVLRE